MKQLYVVFTFFHSLKPPLYVGLEVDTQQLNVPKISISNICSMSIYVSKYQIQILIVKKQGVFINLSKFKKMKKPYFIRL